MSRESANSIASALNHPSCSLKALYLSFEDINGDGFLTILRAVQSSKLERLYIHTNAVFHQATWREFASLLPMLPLAHLRVIFTHVHHDSLMRHLREKLRIGVQLNYEFQCVEILHRDQNGDHDLIKESPFYCARNVAMKAAKAMTEDACVDNRRLLPTAILPHVLRFLQRRCPKKGEYKQLYHTFLFEVLKSMPSSSELWRHYFESPDRLSN